MKRNAWMGWILVLALLPACASKKVESSVDRGEEESNPVFERGLKALEQERYAEAAQIFDKILVAQPGTERDLIILYNSAAAYEGMGHCQKAVDRYRSVVRSSKGKFVQLEAQSLFRMSIMYECLGQDTKTITSLLDARKRGKDLPYETQVAEIPGRLAAAYARMGNRDKALEYFNQASEGLKKIVSRTNNHRQKELLGRTLFLMGQLNHSQRSAEARPSSYMQSLSMQQPYLLQAIEMDHPVWSKKAAEDLKLGYENIWKFQIESTEDRRAFYTRGLQVIQELKRIRLPGAGSLAGPLFADLDRTEAKLNAELTKIAEINKLTPAAESREGLKRQGRLVDPAVPSESKPKPKAKR